jgi:hypothetical protein|tara:strand:- start:426 stop:578 length:153 start_codon:yes stop_codon:yes gene_type:complete
MSKEVETYVRENYKQTFGDKPLIVEEKESCYLISISKDDSPLILSKNINL